MIEFVISRVTIVMCSIAILAVILLPVQSFYDNRYDNSMAEAADKLSFAVDEFWVSEADTMTIRGWEVMPPDSHVEIEGHHLTMYMNDQSYISLLSNSMPEIMFGYNDEVEISKS